MAQRCLEFGLLSVHPSHCRRSKRRRGRRRRLGKTFGEQVAGTSERTARHISFQMLTELCVTPVTAQERAERKKREEKTRGLLSRRDNLISRD